MVKVRIRTRIRDGFAHPPGGNSNIMYSAPLLEARMRRRQSDRTGVLIADKLHRPDMSGHLHYDNGSGGFKSQVRKMTSPMYMYIIAGNENENSPEIRTFNNTRAAENSLIIRSLSFPPDLSDFLGSLCLKMTIAPDSDP